MTAVRTCAIMRASLAASLKLALYAVIIYWIWDSWRVDFLLVGDVTIDLVHGKPVAGGMCHQCLLRRVPRLATLVQASDA